MSNLATLKPCQKGEVRNPYGRKGKSGKGGLMLKTEYQAWLASLSEDQRKLVWNALYAKACNGDIQAIKLLVSMNNENPDYIPEETADTAPTVTIVMPTKETVETVKK